MWQLWKNLLRWIGIYKTPVVAHTPTKKMASHFDGIAAHAIKKAEAAARVEISLEGTNFNDWLDVAANRILSQWPDFGYDNARHNIRDYLLLGGIKFPDSAYDWSYAAARNIADEFMNDFGESISNG